jgi:hypothetical protein
MGLDQYVMKRRKDEAGTGRDEEVLYLRKENAIQGYFERQYGLDNMEEVLLIEDDVEALLEELKAENLEPTEGFFYGSQDPLTKEWYKYMTEQWEAVLRKIQNSSEDETFYYYSWY